MKKNKDKIFNLILSVLPFACILLIWGISANSVGNDKLLPSVKETFRKFFFLFTYSEFYSALLGTLLRSVIAFVCSFAIAFGLALLCMRFNKANVVISPVIAILRALPTIAVVLMLLVWTNSLVAPVIVTMIVVLPTTFTSVKTALLAVDKEQLEMCRLFNVERKKILSKVYIPQIMPDMMLGRDYLST